MEQPCPRCGYFSDRPARFCRQCGTPLFAETEASQAATRNYAPAQQPAAPPSYTPYPSIQSGATDEQAPETTRFYQPPVAPVYPAIAPQPQRRSRGKIVLLIALLCFLVIGGGITRLIISAVHRNSSDRWSPASKIEQKVREQVEREVASAIEKAQREADKARREAGANGAPVPPSAPDKPPVPIEQYHYPGARITQNISAWGNEVVEMTTADPLDKVREHYQKLVGERFLQSHDAKDESVIFQTSGSPAMIIALKPDKREPGKTAISIVRTSWSLPKISR